MVFNQQNHQHHEWVHLGPCIQSKPGFYLHSGKKYVTMSTASSAVITKESQAVRNHDSNMPHCSSYSCSNSTGKDSISELFCCCYPLNRPELKQWSSGFVGIDRHSADARRPGWIDLTMKTTTKSRQTSPHISYILYMYFYD